MRRYLLPSYEPRFPAPERHVLTLLYAALSVAEDALREEHPLIDHAPHLDEHHAPLVVTTAKLIVDRCAELRALCNAYDAAVDHVAAASRDDEVPF